MKHFATSILFFGFILISAFTTAQIICIKCYDQNHAISTGVNNLVVNGGFENTNCGFNSNTNSFCPNSSNYNCNITNWACTGGGFSTYACFYDSTYWYVQEGNRSPYFGNSFCKACSPVGGDMSCLTDSACTVTGIPSGYPSHNANYGGTTGISLSQTVTGLVPGNIYVLEFWAGGENYVGNFVHTGLFAVDIGFGNTFLRCKPTMAHVGIGNRYIIEFYATSSSHVIKFTNWGHICTDCTELVLDDVKLYILAELSASVPPCTAIFSAGAISTNANCGQCNGTATANPLNGTAPFSYLWSNAQTTQTIDSLCPGPYAVTITDANQNTAMAAVSVSQSGTSGTATIQSSQSTMCAGDSIEICVNGNHIGYLWNTGETTSCIQAQLAGNYYVTVTDNNGCTVESNRIAITVLPLPPVGISVNGDTLSVYDAVTQQWYLNGSAINNATSNIYIAAQSGSYTVAVTDTNGCVATSSPVIISGIDNVSEHDIVIVAQMTVNGWQLTVGNNWLGSVAEVFDANGRVVFQSSIVNCQSSITPDVAKGVYLLRISSGKSSVVRKLVRL